MFFMICCSFPVYYRLQCQCIWYWGWRAGQLDRRWSPITGSSKSRLSRVL